MRNVLDVDPTDEIILPKDAAKMLLVEETTLATWRSTNRYPLRYLKIGHLVRYRKSDVLAFLNFGARGGE